MNLEQILNYRRSVRYYSDTKLIDTEKVAHCLRLAQLAPTSSNMQLYEMYHITDKDILKKLASACLEQSSADTAQEMVVFVTRQDLHRKREKEMLRLEIENIKRTSPAEKQEKRIKKWEMYYEKFLPIVYSRFFGILGIARKITALGIGLFRPMMRQVSEADMRIVVHKSCGLVAQTFMLAMAEQGYDTCPLEGFDSLRVKKLLKLPCGAEINMVVTCGIREEKGVWGDRTRLPFQEVYRKI